MSQLLIRNLKEETVDQLKHRAETNHRSLEAEILSILEGSVKVPPSDFWDSAERIRMRLQITGGSFSDSTELLKEDRNQ